MIIPPTPTISTQPKRSWFAAMLNFKPEVFHFISLKTIDETLAFMAERLNTYEVKFQARKDGFKCKYEGSGPDNVESLSPGTPLSPVVTFDTIPSPIPESETVCENSESLRSSQSPSLVNSPTEEATTLAVDPLKSVKFKIEVLQMGEGDDSSLKIQFTQQQGAFSSFQMVVNRFKQDWNLDAR
jgi:hypothetical protein